jgi:hypothetical protein
MTAASAPYTLLLLLVVLALPPVGRAGPQLERERDSLPRGSSIAVEDHASDVLVSPNGVFACGFYAVSPTVFTFSVWFARPSADRAVVWTAARRPVHSQGSRLALDARRGALVLTDYDGELVWNSTTAAGDGAARARLRDTGSLAVEDARGAVLWQSFDHPTDTLLPAQSVGGSGGSGLVSSGRLLAAGHYGFRFSDYAMLSLVYDDGAGQVSSIYWPNPYFSYWQNSRKIYNFSRQAQLDSSGHFLSSDNATFDAADLGAAGVRRRLSLDTDGNLRLYSLDAGAQTWTVSWMAFPNPCIIHGVCGANAVCLYTPAPSCVCAPGHERADPHDWSRGCRPTFRNFTTGVRRDLQVKFVELPHTDFWGFDLNNSEFLSLDACQAQCAGEPSCVVFQYKQGKGECYPKSLMFNGRTFPGLPGTAYLKVPADFDVPEVRVHQWQTDGISGLATQEDIARCEGSPEFLLNVSGTARTSSGQGKSLWFYFYGFLSAFFVIEVFVIAFGCWLFSKKGILSRPSELLAVEEGYRIITSHFRAYSYSELERATRKFRTEIGHGGSGIVYKGVLDDERAVAVKVLQDVSQSEEVFQAELSAIGRIYHMNLVRMWGFCSEGAHRILVYEYVDNGSLANVLFRSSGNSGKLIGWKQRFNIALGVAKGLASKGITGATPTGLQVN